jgi:cell division protein FtsQ
VAGILAYVCARETSVFALRSIEITGAPPRVVAHVRAALRPLEGKSLLALKAPEIERRIDRLSDVAAVSYDRDFPHTLRVDVIPAHSIAVLRRGASAWVVSSDGRVVRETHSSSAPRLPRVWVPSAVNVEVGSMLADGDAVRAIHVLAVARRAGFAPRIAAIRTSERELTFVLASGVEVRLGEAASVALKLAVAERILRLVRTAGAYVDVSVPERPIAGRKA